MSDEALDPRIAGIVREARRLEPAQVAVVIRELLRLAPDAIELWAVFVGYDGDTRELMDVTITREAALKAAQFFAGDRWRWFDGEDGEGAFRDGHYFASIERWEKPD